MTEPKDVAGSAALSICEALLLALNDRAILPESEIMGQWRDAAAAHENAPETDIMMALPPTQTRPTGARKAIFAQGPNN